MIDKPVKKNLYKVEFEMVDGYGFPSLTSVQSPCQVRAGSYTEVERLMVLFGERVINAFTSLPSDQNDMFHSSQKFSGIRIRSIALMSDWIVDETDFDIRSDPHALATQS